MSIVEKLKPKFWNYQETIKHRQVFNFRRIWKTTVLFTCGIALIPLIIITFIDYNVTQKSIESENLQRTSRFVSNVRRTVSFFLNERKSALDFIIHDNSYDELNNPMRLSQILESLKQGFGGFADLGLIDAKGLQQTYIGRYKLEGKNYSDQDWFREVVSQGSHISDVFMGYRHVPHLVIAIKKDLHDGSFFILRASLDFVQFNELLNQLEVSSRGDTFLINRAGAIQTTSRYYGNVLDTLSIPVPEYSENTQVIESKNPDGEPIIVGYAYIAETPFILMTINKKKENMDPWYKTRRKLIGFLAVSITIIMIWILGITTYLVDKIHISDQKRLRNLHMAEYSSKMASIGRLAAGVAHEVNNPLAIINEKAGLIKDMFTFKKEYADDPKLMNTVDSILKSVERCGRITRRLLNFARHMDVTVQHINLKEVIGEVFGFLEKEAEYRSIQVVMDIPDDIPEFESDRGKLQQIFLNLINNAFSAMSDGGRLEIRVQRKGDDFVSITCTDNGCGIPEADLGRVFEPFFTTKSDKGGTGLGLSITYGLVKELQGKIDVKSRVGEGTSFTVTLPLKMRK